MMVTSGSLEAPLMPAAAAASLSMNHVTSTLRSSWWSDQVAITSATASAGEICWILAFHALVTSGCKSSVWPMGLLPWPGKSTQPKRGCLPDSGWYSASL